MDENPYKAPHGRFRWGRGLDFALLLIALLFTFGVPLAVAIIAIFSR